MIDYERSGNWSFHDPANAEFIAGNYDRLRALSHIDSPALGSRAERFTEPNQGWSVQQELDRAIALGMGIDFCGDMYYGNGRQEDGGSATLLGKYHYSHAEGGVNQALDSWNANLPWKHIRSFCFPNEMEDKKWLADHFERYWAQKIRSICRQRGVPFVGYDGEHLGPMFKRVGADVLDVHGIGSSGHRAAQKIKSARRHGLPVWMLEFSGANANVYRSELEAVLNELKPGEVVGAFPGSSTFPNRNNVQWNGKGHYQFNHWYRGGITDPGLIWQELLGTGDKIPPPIEPPDPPIVPPDPDEEISMEDAQKAAEDAQWIRDKVMRRTGKEMREGESENAQARCDDIIRSMQDYGATVKTRDQR